ncbi:MAG: J domain-containing protein [Anaerolineae bacterium]|jgi:hypothetical protein|nr:J domain-containing protein [Anaerolineae bacterium]
MRYETLNAGSYLVWRLQHASTVQAVQDDGDLIGVRLTAGEDILIHLVERPLPLRDLRHLFTTAGQQGRYSLFIFHAAYLLPDHDTDYIPDDWMAALLSVQGPKIYACENAGAGALFFPVYFLGQGRRRRVRYGDVVDYAGLYGSIVTGQHPGFEGRWYVAGFGTPRAGAPQQDRTPLAHDFALLNLPDNAPPEAVKQAFRALARQWHPDINRSREAHLHMKQLNAAYQRILAHRPPGG